MPVSPCWSAPDPAPARPAAGSSFPYSCREDDGARGDVEHDANGLYLGGPKLAQPTTLQRLIAEAAETEPPDLARAQAAAAIAAARKRYRQSLFVAAIRGAA